MQGALVVLYEARCQHQTMWDPTMAEPSKPQHSCTPIAAEDGGTPDRVRSRFCLSPWRG